MTALYRKTTKSERQRGGQPRHAGATRKLVPLEQVKASYDLKPPVCYQCGQPLAGEDSEPYRHQVTDILPVVAEVTEYRVHTLVCEGCGAETSAELPVGVPPTAFGPCLQAMVSLLSGRCHLSKRDAAEVMTDFFQAEVSLGAVPTLEQRTGQAIKAPVDEAHAYVKRQPLVHLDETGWREANQKAWLWLAATTLVTVFFIRPSRGGTVAREILETALTGIVVSDR